MSNVTPHDPQKSINWRYLVFIGVMLAMFGYLLSGLVRLQLVNSDVYKEKAEDTRTKTIITRGKRGNITDADSVILAKDELVHNITFYKDGSNVSKGDYYRYTQSIVETIEIIERNGGELAFGYVIERNEETGEWQFNFGSGVSDSVLATRESQWRSNNYVTTKYYPEPVDCLQRLKRKYRIVQNDEDLETFKAIEADDKTKGEFIRLDEDTMLKVMAVYSEMQMNLFNSLPIPIAKDVAYETVIEVETRAMLLPGMGVEIATKRVYPKHNMAAQIIGYVGKIPSRTKWLELQAEGYSYNDTIGRDGIEYSMESWLTASSNRTQGSRVVERDNYSTIVRELSYTEPEDGNNVKLTIRSAYQQQAERCITNNVEQVRDKQEALMVDSKWLESNRTDIAKRNWERYPLDLAEHGVMVVLDMEDRVLAMANFPTYDLNALVSGGKEARAILADDRNLMLNYAIGSRATPGSIFKMVTGFGVLSEGELSPTERFTDMGYYTKYNKDESTAPKCWISAGQRYKHQAQTIVEAISNSCNFFFYEMGDRLGEERLYRYASLFGLTSLTGIDLPGEVRSVVGSQDTLYDPSKPMGEAYQDTSMPIIVYNSLKSHLRAVGAKRGLDYDDERLSVCAKRLMDMAINYPQGEWVPQMRIILMEELGMTKTMVYLNEVIQDAYIYMNDIKWGGQQTILTAIGQSVTTITPIAAARYVAAVANGGYVYNVSIIDSIISPEGEILSQREPTEVNQLNDPNGYMALIRKGMAGVTDDTGTATKYFRDYKKVQDVIAAKTGTAQVTSIDLENNAWFVCFAPRENPEIAICVFIPHGYSGGMASIAARDFINWYLDQSELRTTDYTLPGGNSLAP
ncbi:MAG: penicillin-binding transpeptidase domain-containing protein [Clostridiales bacterium]|nr:penicillin-binding transpeptidase domain-containing protein [Clostridiales bacterium]